MNPLRRSSHPLLLEIPVRPWIRRLSAAAGRSLTLGEVPPAELDAIRARGFQGVWLMGIWSSGPQARRCALSHPDLLRAYRRVLPDWEPPDVGGSPYAVRSYEPTSELGTTEDLAHFRRRLHAVDLGLVLDFVPNHVGIDHPWLDDRPGYLVRGTVDDLTEAPSNWFVHASTNTIFGHGRDPHFPGWTDTCQIDYRSAPAREAMTGVLCRLGDQCDGLRCDMAMLSLPDVFHSVWGEASEPWDFWPGAIARLRAARPDVLLIAEVYWGLDRRLREAGFDFTYDKQLYDALVGDDTATLVHRLRDPGELEAGRVRFLENHDEERALEVFGSSRLAAAATLSFTLPGLRLFHDGQEEGRALRVPIQLSRAPREPVVAWCREFHERLFRLLEDPAFHAGEWAPLEVRPSGEEKPAPFLGGTWTHGAGVRLVAVNWSAETRSARLAFPGPAPGLDPVRVEDILGGAHFEQNLTDLMEKGIPVELSGFEARAFRVSAKSRDEATARPQP